MNRSFYKYFEKVVFFDIMKKTKISEDKKHCCNPYGAHGPLEPYYQNVTPLLIDRAKVLNITLEIGQKLCKACLNKINRQTPVSTTSVSQPSSSTASNQPETSGTRRIKKRKITGSASKLNISDVLGSESEEEVEPDAEVHMDDVFQDVEMSSQGDTFDPKPIIDQLNIAFQGTEVVLINRD